jgi:hypothetical protein
MLKCYVIRRQKERIKSKRARESSKERKRSRESSHVSIERTPNLTGEGRGGGGKRAIPAGVAGGEL